MAIRDIDELVQPYKDRLVLLVAHFSDLHVKAPGGSYRNRGPERWLQRHEEPFREALSELANLERAPDFLALTGDLTETGSEAEFSILSDCLSTTGIPIRVVPGNHDRLPDGVDPEGQGTDSDPDSVGDLNTAFRRWYQDWTPATAPPHPETAEFHFSEILTGWDVVGIDTSHNRRMSASHRAWIDETLGCDTGRPRLVLGHSPLLAVGNWMDVMCFHDSTFMTAFIGYPRIRAVLSGHVHINRTWRYRGAIHVVTTSLSYGIGDGVGYSLIGLGEEDVLFVCRRYLAGESRDLYGVDRSVRDAMTRLDTPRLYESSPLCHPRIWPWTADPDKRS